MRYLDQLVAVNFKICGLINFFGAFIEIFPYEDIVKLLINVQNIWRRYINYITIMSEDNAKKLIGLYPKVKSRFPGFTNSKILLIDWMKLQWNKIHSIFNDHLNSVT